MFACCFAISFDSALVSCQHIPHSLHRFFLRGSGNVGVGVQGEAGGVVTQHAGDGFDVYTVLQGQGGEGVMQVVEAKLRQPCALQYPVEHVAHTVRGDRPAGGRGEHILAALVLLHFFQHFHCLFGDGNTAVGVFRFQRYFFGVNLKILMAFS